MIDFQNIDERNKIKSAVAAREIDVIQVALDNKQFALKSYPTKAVDIDKHEIGFVITQDSVDRDGERILPSAFKKDFDYYLDNPVVLYNHNMSNPAVGQMVNHKIGDEDIQMRVKFAVDENPMAAMLWKLYSADPPYMRMTSAGFIPIEATDKSDMKLEGQKNMTYTRVEMIELSFVNIGANRYATSMLAKGIQDDPVLKSVYEQAVEEPIALPVLQSIESDENTTLQMNVGDDENPIFVSVSTPGKKEVIMAKDNDQKPTEATPCPKCAAESEKKGAATSTKRIVVLKKGMTLADTLNAAIGDDDDRSDIIESLANEADIEASTVNQILSGEIDCPPMERLEGFARALDISLETLTDAAMEDGCEYEMGDENSEKSLNRLKTKEMGTEDDASKQKYYDSYLNSMRPAGSIEEIKSEIYNALDDYLAKNLPDVERWEYLDYELIGTYPDEGHVLVYCWNTKSTYQIDYTEEAGMIELSNMVKGRLSFQPDMA